jgi:hypothetical protein
MTLPPRSPARRRPKTDPTCPPGWIRIEDALMEGDDEIPAGEVSRAMAREHGLSEEQIDGMLGKRR